MNGCVNFWDNTIYNVFYYYYYYYFNLYITLHDTKWKFYHCLPFYFCMTISTMKHTYKVFWRMLVTVLFHRRKKGIQYSLEWHECKFWQNFIIGWTQAHFIPDSSPTQVMFMSLSCSLSYPCSHPVSYYCLSTKMAAKKQKNCITLQNIH